jgi:hypothetical protein
VVLKFLLGGRQMGGQPPLTKAVSAGTIRDEPSWCLGSGIEQNLATDPTWLCTKQGRMTKPMIVSCDWITSAKSRPYEFLSIGSNNLFYRKPDISQVINDP